MFDGDNFWKICGVWEKSISLMMKIALFFTKFFRKILGFLTFFLPVFLLWLYLGYLINRKYDSDKVSVWCLLIFMVILFTHGMGGLAYFAILKECMRGLTIGWLRLNLILVLALVGLQAYVSLIKCRFSESATKFEKIIHIDLTLILWSSQNILILLFI